MDGTLLTFYANDVNNDPLVYYTVYVDLNGWRKPNQLGNDFFYFYYYKDPKRIVPGGWSLDEESKQEKFETACLLRYGYNCTNWFLEYGNRDYLRCKDLIYNKKTKCGK